MSSSACPRPYRGHCVSTPIPLNATQARRQKARECWKMMELRSQEAMDGQEGPRREGDGDARNPPDAFDAMKPLPGYILYAC